MNSAAAIKSNVNVMIPAAARVPSDILALDTLATLGFCPSKSAERRARVDFVASMIASTLATNGQA
jgi:hypothetical protein